MRPVLVVKQELVWAVQRRVAVGSADVPEPMSRRVMNIPNPVVPEVIVRRV